jgi:hypothetical protein
MLTDDDRSALCGHLERTRQLALAAIDGLTDAQWNFRSSPDAWSVGEIAEHIAVSEAVVFERVAALITGAPEPERAAEVAGKDRILVERVPKRGGRQAQAPEAMRPRGRQTTRSQVSEAISEGRERTLRFVKTTEADLRSFCAVHPALQLLDAYQWLLLVATHTERHVRQIEECKQAPEYPAA